MSYEGQSTKQKQQVGIEADPTYSLKNVSGFHLRPFLGIFRLSFKEAANNLVVTVSLSKRCSK